MLGCYTCNIYRVSLTSIATYEGYMSRDNGSFVRRIRNIECTSTSLTSMNIISTPIGEHVMEGTGMEWKCMIFMDVNDVDVSAIQNLPFITNENNLDQTIIRPDMTNISDMEGMAEDLYSHQYGLRETIKTISNSYKIQNIIIPLFNGTGSVFPVMIIFCIRDSLREYKSNYNVLSNMKLSFYKLLMISEVTIICLILWLANQSILSPLYMTYNL
jgi:hypothetical protein